MTRITTAGVLRKRFLFKIFSPMVAALACTVLFVDTAALIAPKQSPLALNLPARTAQMRLFRQHVATGAATPTPSGSIGSAQHAHRSAFAPRSFQRQPSALRSGPSNNNNNDVSSSGGAGDMDPGLKLLICVLIDFIGVASFAVPGLGEATDVGWAPVSALLVNYLFGNGIFTALALVEELSPGFDFIPTATIAWFVENGNKQEMSSKSEAGSAPRSQTANPPPPRPSQPTNKKPLDSDVIDADIID